jgi:hypothetical protein
MSKVKNLSFTEAESWIVQLAARDAQGRPYDLTGGSAAWAFGVENGATLLTAAGVLVEADQGLVEFNIAPASHAAVPAGEYVHEMRVTLADTTVSTQVRGRLTVTASP